MPPNETSPSTPSSSPSPATTVADVALPVPVLRTFAYRVPEALAPSLRRGCRVNVPFGSRLTTGFVVGFDPEDAPAELKEIHSVLDPEPLVDEHILELTKWIAERTLCSWGEALRASLPGHTNPRREKVVSLGAPAMTDLFGGGGTADLEHRIIAVLGEEETIAYPQLAKKLGLRVPELEPEVRRLVRAGKLRLTERIAEAVAGPPRIKLVRLTEASLVPTGSALAPSEPDFAPAPGSSASPASAIGSDGLEEALRRASTLR